MIAIISGSSLGLNLSSLGVGPGGPTGNAGQSRNGETAYVNVANGNLVLQSQDDYLVSRGLDAVAIRTYNSQGLFGDDNGDNWSSGAWLQPLRLTGTLNAAGSTLQRTDRDGSVATYAYDGTRYVSTDGDGAYDTIGYVTADSQYEWQDGATGVTQRYSAAGRLLSSRDPSGNSLTYAYNAAGRLASVTSATGESTFYDYDAANNLTQMRTVTTQGATSTRVRYAYDTGNRLATVSVDLTPGDNSIVDGKVYQTTYTYDGTSKRVATIGQTDGTTFAFTYVDVGGGNYKVATVRDALNHTTTFTYGSGFTTASDATGNITRYDMDSGGRVTKISPPGVTGGLTGARQFTYNAGGDVLSATDGEGRTVAYHYDAKGNQVLQRDHAGNTVARTYSAANQLLTETLYLQPDLDGSGAGQPGVPVTTRNVYDAGGRNLLRFTLSAEGRVTEYRYNGFGEQVAVISYQAGTYPVAGLAAAASLTEGDLVAWAGTQPAASTSRVDMVYDARGQLQSRTSYAKVATDGAGIADGTQSLEHYVYDQSGLLLQAVSARGGSTTYTYDGLGRVLSSTNALGQVAVTQYQDSSRKTVLTLANGLITTSTHDAAGRLVSVVQSSPSVMLGETKYFHDPNGRLRMTQDPTGVRQWSFYDEAGRKTADVDGNGTLTEYTYDRNDLVTRVDVWGTAVNTAALVDAGGQPVSMALPALRPGPSVRDSSTWRAYDAAHRLVREATTVGTSTSASVTESRYDGASRLVEVIRYATVVAADGGAGSVAAGTIPLPPASAHDRITRHFYDADARLAGTLDAEGYLTAYTYDAAGRLTGSVRHAAITDAAQRAAGTLAQLRPADSASDIRTFTLYDGKAQVVAQVDGEGYLTENVYDASGNVVQSVRYANRVVGAVTGASNVASIRPASSPLDRATSRVYDALNRITQETSPEGVITQYTYDNAGNLISTARAVGTTEVRTLLARYDLQGRLTGELSAVGAALLTGGQTQAQVDAIWLQHGTSHTYDAASRRTSSTNPAGARSLFYYNADGAQTHTVNALGEVRETRYDDVGRVAEEHVYSRRISTAGLTGGLVTAALTNATSAVALATDLRVRYTYTKDGRIHSEWDGQGNHTYRTYNAFGEQIRTDQELGAGLSLSQAYTLDRRGLRTGTTVDPFNSQGLNAIETTTYDAFGRAIRTVDAMGNVREHSFDRLGRVLATRDPSNALRSTSYDAFDRVLTQTDALGSATTYTYDAATRRMIVTTPEGIVTTTTYTRHGQVQSFADGKGQIASYSYDRNGNLLQTTTPLTSASNAYDGTGRLTQTTDANGHKVAYTYDAANRVLTRRVDPAGLNLTTTYAYDGKGQQVSLTDPSGVATTTEYDNQGRVTRQTVDPAGLSLQTVYTYNARGNVLSVTSPGGTLTQYVYDVLGRRVQERLDPAGLNLQRSWAYDKNGNATSSTDPLGHVTRYAYDSDDRLVFTVDPLGQVRQLAYDAEGRLVRSVAYATPINTAGLGAAPTVAQIQSLVISQAAQDVVEHRVYDRDSRIAATVDGTGGVIRYTYDANGNVTARVAHANRINLGTWVAGTLPAPTADNARDAREVTVYDALNRATYSVNGIGAVVARTYDGNGNVVRRTDFATAIPANTSATQAAISTAVAVVANVARDATVRHTYDAAGRLTWSADGTGAVTQRVYDKNGNVVRQLAYATAVAASAVPSSVAASANDRATSLAYDNANRLVLQVDALRSVTEYVHDGNGNVVRQTAYANRISSVPTLGTTGSAGAIRALLTSNLAADRSTRHGYDAAGRQVLAIDATGAAMETQYDAAGQAIATTTYANPVNTASLPAAPTLGSMKALVTVNVTSDRVTKTAYDAAGRAVYAVDAAGAVKQTQYDGVGRVTRATSHAKTIAATTANTAAAVAAALLADAADQTQAYSYNAAGQLIANTNAVGHTESYTYDAVGNRLTFTNRKGSVWTYTYDAAGRLLTETSPQVSLTTVTVRGTNALAAGATANATIVTRMGYDALGNLTERTEAFGRAEARTTRYEYDAVGRQVRVIHPPVGVYNASGDAITSNGATGIASRVESLASLETQTFYDALGNAVASRDVGGATSQKSYDLLGRVAYEVDAMGFVTGYARNTFGDVTHLTRYGTGTTLANVSITQAAQAATKAQVDAVLGAAGFSHANDRVLLNQYDRSGRVTETSEPVAWVYDANSGTGGTAAKTTRNTYDAFGQLVQVQTLRNAANAWSTTTHYYDKAGNQQASIDALGYLTWRSFDAIGNVTELREYAAARAAGSWSLAGYGSVVNPAGDDRTTRYTYDRLNRKTAETRLNVEFSTANNGTSTRGSLSTTHGYDAVGNQTRVTDADGKITYTYYDPIGRITAVAAPPHASTVSGSTLTPLSVFRRDAYGNVVVKIDYANGAASAGATTFTAGAASADDRTTLAAYDSFGRTAQTTNATGASEFFSYDAFGHVAKKWQGVTGNDGITRTLFEVNVYDKLGQLVETRTPASTTVFQGGLNAAYTARTMDEAGTVLTPNRMVLGWSGMVDPQGGTVRVQVEYMASSTQVFNEFGSPISGQPAHLESTTKDVAAASATSGAEVTWTAGTDHVVYIRVLQLVNGQWVTKWEGPPAQASGSGIGDLTQAQAGMVFTGMEYNAFGELIRRGTQGGRQEYFDYDAAGRLWRTNSGDGVDRINLYDAQGEVTSEIRSSGSGRDNIDIKGFVNAEAAGANPYTRRVDVKLDALGRVTATVQAARVELQGGVSVQRMHTTATVTQSATTASDESGPWASIGQNAVSLAWNGLSSLGSGDVKVYLEYRTPVFTSGGGTDEYGREIPLTYSGGSARTYSSGMFTSDAAAAGVNLAWPDTGTDSDVGIGKVTRIVVYKKDAAGIWTAVIDQQPGYGSNVIDVAAPPNSASALTLQLRTAGSAGDTGWWTVGLAKFGDAYRFDARGLAIGNYEYRVTVTPLNEAGRVTGTGVASITQPPLNSISADIAYGQSGAGVLSWTAPGSGMEQVLRYRPSGSTGGWSSLAVTPRNNGARDGVDTAGLAAGTYQFELLWTQAGQGVPSSHATGTFAVVAAVAPVWVPPVNLPHVTGLSIGSTVVGGSFGGHDEAGNPIYYGGTTVPALVWNAANATVAQYRLAGGAWTNLTIDNAGQFSSESGYTGVQKAALNGIAAGNYEVRILVGTPPTAQATGNLAIYPQSAGYYQTVYVQVATYQPVIAYYAPVYETRYGTRQVSYQQWVDDPPVLIGRDEYGQPIYSYPGHYETRYYTETYTYQVQVGTTPVYATDENGNIIYQTVWVTQAQQQWVPGTTPTPAVSVTTPPYTPGYTIPGTPQQYGVSVTTTAGSVAISTTDGAVMGQSVGLNGDSRWLRPTVLQKTDRWGNVIEVTDPRSAYWKTTYKYNANNQLVLQTQPDPAGGSSGPAMTIYYDKVGRQIAVKDANGRVSGQVFDASGNLAETRNADGSFIAHRYNAFGEKVKTIDAEGKVATFTYDRMGHMLSMAKGTAGVYRANGANAIEYVATRNITDSWTYDQLGRKLTQTNGNNETLSYKYDLRGNVVETRQPLGQVLRAAFDAQGRKIAEADANGYASTWSYDYFGQVTGHTDLGGARYTYSYDHARQLVWQGSTRGQSISYGYDAAGQVTTIQDWATGKITAYGYDLSGRRIRERVTQGDAVYQDNHLAYDAVGNLRNVTDARVRIAMEYDKVGNRTRVATYVDYQGVSGETSSSTDRYFKYDAMNRQVVVDAVDAAGNLGQQGHQITYDRNGNRTSDMYWGNKVDVSGGQPIAGYNEDGSAIYTTTSLTYTAATGYTTEVYRYDDLNRLKGVERDGMQVDLRYYDGADRVIQSGPAGALPTQYANIFNQGVAPGEMNGKETRVNRYDANGRLLHQKVLKPDNSAKVDISWDPNENMGSSAFVADGYDAAGNVRGYVVRNHESGMTNEYTTSLARFEGYKAGITNGVSTQLNPGTTTQNYDANGFLVGVVDSTQSNNNRTFVNDSNGIALFVDQAGHVQRQMVVNGEVLGIYGAAVDPNNPTSGSNNNPNFANLVDFDFGYSRISASYPNASPGAYQVRTGDTLRSIAQSAYGDSSLWYRIAEANGLGGDDDLKVGQTLNIPNRVSTISNNSSTFKPYDPSRIEGDMTPNMAMPKADDCGGIGQILMVIVAIVVTIYTAGAAATAMNAVATGTSTFSAGMAALAGGTFGTTTLTAGALGSVAATSMASAAIGAAVGSIASQGVGIAAGLQDSFSWKGVALSALSAGTTAGLGSIAAPASVLGRMGPVGRAMVGNVASQGIAVATGLQAKFSWRAVAAAGVGSAVSQAVAGAIGGNVPGDGMGPIQPPAFSEMGFAGDVLRGAVSGFAGGIAAAAVRGGRVVVQQIAIDAFGNALGQSIAESSNRAMATQARAHDGLGDFIAKNNNWAHVDVGPMPALVNGMTFSETVAAAGQASDLLGIRAMAGDSTSVLRRAKALWGPKPDVALSDASTDADVAAKQMRDAGYEGNMVLAGGASVRVTPGAGVRPAMVNGISVNQKGEAAFQFADDLAGMTGLYRDYKLLGGLMSELQQKTTLDRLQGALQEKLGMMRVMPTPQDLGVVPSIGGPDGGIRYNNADLIDRYSDALRKVEMWKQGIIELDTKSMLIISIGNQRMSPAQWVEENTQRYQRAFAAGVEEGRQKYINGQLRYPVDMPQQLQVGLYGHRFAELEIVSYNRSLGVPEGPGQLLSMNRWSYDPSGSGMTVRADMLLDLGPNRGNQGFRFVVDGKSSVTEAMASGAQFARTRNWLGGASIMAATPQGLLPWIPRRGR